MEDVIEEDGLHLEEDKELRLQVGCWEYQNELCTQTKDSVLAL